jgi:Insecticidal Crystal Toxin, P42
VLGGIASCADSPNSGESLPTSDASSDAGASERDAASPTDATAVTPDAQAPSDSEADAQAPDANPDAATPLDAEPSTDSHSPSPVGDLLVDVKHLFMAPGDSDTALVLVARTSGGDSDEVTLSVSAPDVVAATLEANQIQLEALADGHASVQVATGSGATVTFEVDVSAPRAINVRDEFQVAYVDQFDLAYSDGGTGCQWDGTFWKPNAVPGFLPLGVFGESGYDDPSGKAYTLVVRSINDSDAIIPVDQASLLQSNRGFSVWRPVAPSGYVALSDIILPDGDADLDSFALVRDDLARPAVTTETFWQCADLANALTTQRLAAKGPLEYGEIPLVSNLTAANVQHGIGTEVVPIDPVLNVLVADITVTREYDLGAAGVPRTTTLDIPSATEPVRVRSILVPFNTVADTAYDDTWKIANSPWYRLERRDYYQPVLHRANLGNTDLEQSLSYTVGVTEAASETFSESTSVTVNAELGVALGGFSAGGSISVTQELGYERTMSTEMFAQHMLSETITVPPKTVMTVWQLETRIVLQRYRAGTWEAVGDPAGLISGADSLIFTQADAN